MMGIASVLLLNFYMFHLYLDLLGRLWNRLKSGKGMELRLNLNCLQ